MNNIEKIQNPFKFYCQKVIPLAFDESMSYYEVLCGLTAYLRDTVIPAVNTTSDSVNELQRLYIELKTYVDNYFANLDIQNEINNKLDEMAESGELANIITQYLQIASILVFNNIQEMKTSENLVNGSLVETYGFYELNDGGGAKYKVRNVTNTDVIDDTLIFRLANTNLVAELVTQDTMNTIQLGILGDNTDETEKLQKFLNLDIEKYIISNGDYLISANLEIQDNSIIEFMESATINRQATDSGTYFMLNIVNKSNIKIINAHLVGDRDTHLGSTGEWGYGINIAYSQNILIENATIEKTWGDGIYIGNSYQVNKIQTTKYINILNNKILNCSRNGISITYGENINIDNCYIYGINRTNPKSGIDIEPEGKETDDKYIKDLNISNLITENNTSGIAVIATNTDLENINIINHKSISDDVGFNVYDFSGKGNIVYKNANIIKCNSGGCYISKVKTNNIVLQNIVIDSTRKSNEQHGYDGGIVIISRNNNDGNLIIDNVEMIKSYEDLYNFSDIIVQRGDGQFDGIKVKNINTSKYMYLNNSININLYNCELLRQSSYYTINIDRYTNSNKIVLDGLQVNATRNIKDSIIDGDYEVILKNNSGGYGLYVVFEDTLTVFNTSSYGGTGKSYSGNYRSAYLKFNKTGNTITILINNGFTAS